MPPIVAHSVGGTTKATRVQAALPALFQLPSRLGRPVESPQVGFIGPVIRGVVWYGNRAFRITERFFDPSTRLGRTFVTLFGPFSVPVQTTKTIALDSVAEVLTHAFGHYAAHELFEWSKHHAVEWYEAHYAQDPQGNASVVFFPAMRPGLDLLKWDP